MRRVLSISLVLMFVVAIAAQCSGSIRKGNTSVVRLNQAQDMRAAFKLNPAQGDSALSGYVRYANKSAAKGVVLSIGNFSVTSDANGFYRLGYISPGVKTIWVTPPGKQARSFSVQVGASPTQKDFVVDW